jgi:hypothetical protein
VSNPAPRPTGQEMDTQAQPDPTEAPRWAVPAQTWEEFVAWLASGPSGRLTPLSDLRASGEIAYAPAAIYDVLAERGFVPPRATPIQLDAAWAARVIDYYAVQLDAQRAVSNALRVLLDEHCCAIVDGLTERLEAAERLGNRTLATLATASQRNYHDELLATAVALWCRLHPEPVAHTDCDRGCATLCAAYDAWRKNRP